MILCVLVLVSAGYAGDFTQWRGEGRAGVVNEANLLDSIPASGPALLWSTAGIGTGYSSAIEVSGKVFITGMKEKMATLTAISRDKGEILWQKEFGLSWAEKQYGGERTTPTYDNGRLYVFSPVGQLHCFTVEGDLVWSVDTFAKFGGENITWGVSESVVVEGDMVICTPGGKTAVIALNKNNGKLLWKAAISGNSAYCSPVVVDYAGKRMLITVLDKTLCGINTADGSVLWQIAHKVSYDINAVTPIFDKGLIYVSNGYKHGGRGFQLAPDASSIKQIWTDKKLDCQLGGLSYANGIVFGINLKGNIVALELATGKVVAQSDPYIGKGALLMADGKFFCYGESGKVGLVKFDGTKFSLAGSFEIKQGEDEHWAHPTIANGSLYIRHGDYLMAYKVSK